MSEKAPAKKPWESKQLWVSLIVAVAGFIPPAREWIAGNPEAFSAALGLVFTGLRLVTDSKVSIK